MEQKLIDLGAETVCGDLILNRVTVGMYRSGVFIPTPEGKEAFDAAVAAEAAAKTRTVKPVPVNEPVVEPDTAPAPAPAAKTTRKKKAEAPAEEAPAEQPVEEAPADAPVQDTEGDLDNLLAGTGLDA